MSDSMQILRDARARGAVSLSREVRGRVSLQDAEAVVRRGFSRTFKRESGDLAVAFEAVSSGGRMAVYLDLEGTVLDVERR